MALITTAVQQSPAAPPGSFRWTNRSHSGACTLSKKLLYL